MDPASYGEMHYDRKHQTLYIYREIYAVNMTNQTLAERIKAINPDNEMIIADSAEPKSNAELRRFGLKVSPSKKGADSVEYGVKFLQSLYRIVIDDRRCPNTAREFTQYEYERDAHGNFKAGYPDKDNHCLTGDTIVHTSEGDIPIRDLVGKTGSTYCFDEQNQVPALSPFFDVRKTRENAEIYELEVEDGRTVRLTADHLVLTRNGWVEAQDLTCEDEVVSVPSDVHVSPSHGTTSYARVKGIRLVGREDVYNMEVETHHNFAVNGGLIVHNCIDMTRYAMNAECLAYRDAHKRKTKTKEQQREEKFRLAITGDANQVDKTYVHWG